jgi:arylformamidase
MEVYKGLTREELQAQYYLRALRPDYEVTVIPDWLDESKRFVDTANGTLDIEYGPRPRNKLDFFPGQGKDTGFVLYIHGGYWQRGDKSVYSFLARPFVERGFSVAVMNYQMCPDVRISEIAPQARLAVGWLWSHSKELGISRDNFNIFGHSAGGHLTTEMMFTDWTREAEDLPKDLIHAGVSVSGIYDFEPILYCTENEGLKMDAEEARTVSPIYRTPATDAPHLISFGLEEPPDMRRQSNDFFDKFKHASTRMECLPVPDVDHFDVVNVLRDEDSEIFAQVLDFVSR